MADFDCPSKEASVSRMGQELSVRGGMQLRKKGQKEAKAKI
jgi:hypothetical protein